MWESISFLFAEILIITVINLAVLGLVWFIVNRITSRAVQVLIPALVMLIGYLILMKADPANLLLGTHIFIIPMAVLITAILVNGLADPTRDFTNLFLVDFFLSIIAVVVLGFVISSQYLNTIQYYQNIALSNGITYAWVIVFDIVLANVLFSLMRRKRNRYPIRVREKPK